MQKRLWFGVLVLHVLAQTTHAEPQTAATDPVDQTLCGIIETSAVANNLPRGFLTRLIWQESALRTSAISPAGAQGVAQFMPGTAAERGLANPFDPETAIPAAAKYLRELSARFGKLGLADAAYNAGPAGLADWLAGRSELPFETRAYVYAITARSIDAWAKPPPPDSAATPSGAADEQPCLSIVASIRQAAPVETIGESPFAPWGVQLAGDFSKARALAEFQRVRMRYQAILGDGEPFVLASRLCQRLQAAGGSCIVLRS